ncbi:MAG: TonB-dependent receptor [Geobacteraceae bacterium]
MHSLNLSWAAIVLSLGILLTVPIYAAAAQTGKELGSLMELEIEQLMELKVTSVSKKPQLLSDAAAAVFVITQDDLRRSGVTSVADALRMVPGMQVARIDSNKWAISSRGFNSRFASKMLVLFDGRSVYSPLFSGVFWDRQDTVLEDIDRIEVIRGPGATMWGANAVNGVINVITKHADETQGGMVSVGGGTHEQGFSSLRYGVKLGKDTSLRLFGKYLNRSGLDDAAGVETSDRWHVQRGGFRLDSQVTDKDSFTMQGDVYGSRLNETYTTPEMAPPYSRTFNYKSKTFGGSILTRWEHTISEASDLALQIYYDRTDFTYAILGERRDTLDLDFQHRFPLGSFQEILWGLGYRYSHDNADNTSIILALIPSSQTDNLLSGFFQDEITIIENILHLTIGSKFEHNDYTGVEIQPNARLIWTPHKKHSIWAAVSRAVRTPSRAEDSFNYRLYTTPPGTAQNPGPLPAQVTLHGNRELKAEDLLAYELGYRVRATESFSVDTALFYNNYERLVSLRSGTPTVNFTAVPPFVDVPLTLGNSAKAHSYGAELSADLKAADWWRFQAAYTYLRVIMDSQVENASPHGQDPQNQFTIRSSMDIGKDIELDLWLKYVDKLASINVGSYVNMDARLSWKPWPRLEVELVGQNLLNNRTAEFKPEIIFTKATEAPRSVYGKLTWSF